MVTVVEPLQEYAPRPFDTMLALPAGADIRNTAGTSEPLVHTPALLGVAERVEVLPTAPRLIDAVALDFMNNDLRPGPGDTIALYFDRPTNRGGEIGQQAFGLHGAVHLLFDFYDHRRRRINAPFFLEYTSSWLDASTFVVHVINGSDPVDGIIDPDYALGDTAAVDARTRVVLRSGVVVTSEGCPAEYLEVCTAPTVQQGLATAAVPLRGDFGRASAPRIVSYGAADPDHGDAVFGVCLPRTCFQEP